MTNQKANKRDAIFDATLSLCSEVGIAGLKMSAIAKQARIASGTLYLYFDSKEVLLNTLYQKLKREFISITPTNLDELPVKAQLFTLWQQSLRYFVNRRQELFFMEQFLRSPFISDESLAASQGFTQRLCGILALGREQMIIKNTEDDLLVALMNGYMRSLSEQVIRQNITLDESFEAETFALCWDALRA